MKSRHVRALAVFGIVLVTLTGARGSRGGGCDNDHSSGSSSSSSSGGGGSQHHDYDDDYEGSTGSTSGGDEATAAPTPTNTAPTDATKQVEVKYCSVARDRTNLRGHLYISNQYGHNLSYDITVRFEPDPGGDPLVVSRKDVVVGAYQNFHDTITLDYTGPGKANELRKCAVVLATSTVVPS
ncbi:hypothetical protein [Streptomyces sp. NPDC059828]|uniref:hypothetical protein n=1 Tax=Streptomyces sp. NPDC059828 TaxID=3346965 RepID=UPI00364D5B04